MQAHPIWEVRSDARIECAVLTIGDNINGDKVVAGYSICFWFVLFAKCTKWVARSSRAMTRMGEISGQSGESHPTA